jgi:hypothetical protein
MNYEVVIGSRCLYIDYCTRVFLKNHFIVLVLLIRSRLMTKTFVLWTEDMIQSRHRLAQLYGILRITLRSCYWQNHFIEYSCYLQNHLWTTAELTVDNRLSLYARNALHRYVINMSSNVLFPTYTYLWSWQCFYWLKISRCKKWRRYPTTSMHCGPIWYKVKAWLKVHWPIKALFTLAILSAIFLLLANVIEWMTCKRLRPVLFVEFRSRPMQFKQ